MSAPIPALIFENDRAKSERIAASAVPTKSAFANSRYLKTAQTGFAVLPVAYVAAHSIRQEYSPAWDARNSISSQTSFIKRDRNQKFLPLGFKAIRSAPGATLYHQNSDYVQVVDLSKGASVKFFYGEITNPGKRQGAYGGNDPKLRRQTLTQAWESFYSFNKKAFSITNGQFFRNDPNSATITNLAFPVKVNGTIVSDGYAGESEFASQKLMLAVWNNRAEISAFKGKNSLYASSAPNIIVGLSEKANKSINKNLGRTFMGVGDGDSNGIYETVLIFNSSDSTQFHAAETLKKFGADKVIMLDGGGSSQLLAQGKNYIKSTRTIPQTIGVVSTP
ncbi:phosphodiester glycosidase family protein [Coleofasciculus sp. FACHB-1120]|uniref:phosphodiester glycosidase family protein n=1 Tax=Coleofasciculus sp. FACHB-1120 TaxID=2692783 RepID=UPI0016853DDC|nr:phosphodiester glycosidase family protein [Coleofasciculus sp. FACHB-1120]MBD2740726.1 phosphodiester glycosidase family protein [Coleofasciculus sp. FACHB-1120]